MPGELMYLISTIPSFVTNRLLFIDPLPHPSPAKSSNTRRLCVADEMLLVVDKRADVARGIADVVISLHQVGDVLSLNLHVSNVVAVVGAGAVGVFLSVCRVIEAATLGS